MKNSASFFIPKVIQFMPFVVISVLMVFQTNLMAQGKLNGKVLLAVFAHPDDESTVSPILVKYIREGAKVYLVTATDGRFGTNDYTDYIAGEGLVTIRKEEMKCAANKLGVELMHLSYEDQLKSAEGYDGFIEQSRSLIKELHSIMEKIKPDAVITWGPDGGSNHIDHRLIGASVTQVFISQVWDKPSSLYYVGTPTDHIENIESKILRGQDKKYLGTRVAYIEKDLEMAFNSFKCHKSQIPPNMKWEDYKKRRTANGMAIYFRKFEVPKTTSDTVFE